MAEIKIGKANVYSGLTPTEGVDICKANAHAALTPIKGVNICKANVYVVLVSVSYDFWPFLMRYRSQWSK